MTPYTIQFLARLLATLVWLVIWSFAGTLFLKLAIYRITYIPLRYWKVYGLNWIVSIIFIIILIPTYIIRSIFKIEELYLIALQFLIHFFITSYLFGDSIKFSKDEHSSEREIGFYKGLHIYLLYLFLAIMFTILIGIICTVIIIAFGLT